MSNLSRRRFITLLGGTVAWPLAAHAHVKWFAEYDLSKPPLPVGDVRCDGEVVGRPRAQVVDRGDRVEVEQEDRDVRGVGRCAGW